MDKNLPLWNYFTSIVLHKLEIGHSYSPILYELPHSWNLHLNRVDKAMNRVADLSMGVSAPAPRYVSIEAAATTNVE
jgi:hypothetical protein